MSLTLKQFAEAVNLSPQTVSRYIKEKKLFPRRLPSGRAYFEEIDVESFKKGIFVYGKESS